MDRLGERGRVGELVLYLMGVPIGVQILLWVMLGNNLIGAAENGAVRAIAQGEDMGFAIYMLGMLLVIGAFVYGAQQVGLSDTWVGIVAVALLGLGVMGGIVRTRRQDPS